MSHLGEFEADVKPSDCPLNSSPKFFETLRLRRSIRAFEDRPVAEEQFQSILAAANSAPSAGNLQAYEIVVVRDSETKRALVAATSNQAFIASAPVILIFCAHRARSESKYGAGGEFFSIQDATIACAYAELAVAALGLGTVWIGALDPAAIQKAARIAAGWRPIGLLPIGYRNDTPPATPRRRLDEIVHESTRVGPSPGVTKSL